MTDPTRLSAEPESDFELSLLRSGRIEPPPGSKEKAWAAASDALATSLIAGSAVAGGRWAAGGAKAGWFTGLHGWSVFALGAGVVASAIALGLAHRGHPHRETSAEIAAPRAPPVIVSDESAVSSNAFASAAPAVSAPASSQPPMRVHVASAPSSERATKANPAPPGSALRSDGGASTVAAELALLDDARRAAAKGDFGSALSVLDDYRMKFPRGTMTAEATVLRIGVLVRTGDRAGAKRIADAFLATDPDTLYVSRVQSLLGGSNP